MDKTASEAVHISVKRPEQVMGARAGVAGLMGGRQGVPLSVPLPFLLTGMLAAALFSVLLPWNIAEAWLAPGFPHVLALVHLVTLGWLTMTIMGASLMHIKK